MTNAHPVNDQVVELFYKMKESFVKLSDRTNVVLAAFTTTQARLKLYQVLYDLESRVCYYDTDNVIYTWNEGEWEPPLSDFLGQFTNEMDDRDWIETFVAACSKNYVYRTRAGKTCCPFFCFPVHLQRQKRQSCPQVRDAFLSKKQVTLNFYNLFMFLCMTGLNIHMSN